jgi:DnaK suppressor protein
VATAAKKAPAKAAAAKTPAKPAAKVAAKPAVAKVAPKVAAKATVAKKPAKAAKTKRFDELRGDQKKALDALLALRAQLIAQVRDISSSNLASNKQAGEELADIGSDNFYREIGLSMLSEDGRKLMMIQEALDRLQAGTYGFCEDCGCPIAPGRLKALPYAKLCVECQAEAERKTSEFGAGFEEEEEEEAASFGEGGAADAFEEEGEAAEEPEAEEEEEGEGEE